MHGSEGIVTLSLENPKGSNKAQHCTAVRLTGKRERDKGEK